jgi:hypothetical protein
MRKEKIIPELSEVCPLEQYIQRLAVTFLSNENYKHDEYNFLEYDAV